jgi:hypothetical protein
MDLRNAAIDLTGIIIRDSQASLDRTMMALPESGSQSGVASPSKSICSSKFVNEVPSMHHFTD